MSNVIFDKVISIEGGNTCGPFFYPEPNFKNPEAFAYNKNGSLKWIASLFTEVFVYKADPKCLVNTCLLKVEGCTTAYTGTDLVIEANHPWSLKAKENNPLGYQIKICYECQILKIAPLVGTININREIFIEAHPLGCSKTLQYVYPPNYPYKKYEKPDNYQYPRYDYNIEFKNTNEKKILVPSFEDVFKHTKSDDCPV